MDATTLVLIIAIGFPVLVGGMGFGLLRYMPRFNEAGAKWQARENARLAVAGPMYKGLLTAQEVVLLVGTVVLVVKMCCDSGNDGCPQWWSPLMTAILVSTIALSLWLWIMRRRLDARLRAGGGERHDVVQ